MSRPVVRARLATLVLLLAAPLAMGNARAPVAPPPPEVTSSQVLFEDDYDACNGEVVRVNGIQTVVYRTSQDAQGRWHFGFTRNTRGRGVGLVTGSSYVLNDAVTRSSFEITPGQPKTFVEQFSARLIGTGGEKGSGDDSFVHFLTTITLNANGDVTASVQIQKALCK